MEYWWGPYVGERVRYGGTAYGVLEIPTNIAYPQFMVGEGFVANGDLFSHELGHHWWGDIVAPRIHNHMWLKEARGVQLAPSSGVERRSRSLH